ncbi:hypothetical protein KIPB_012665, partial [Kipferlia bialata]
VKNVLVRAQPASVRRHIEETKGTPLNFELVAEDALYRRPSVLRLSQRGRICPAPQAGEETLSPAEELVTILAQPDTDAATDTDGERERETRDGEAAGLSKVSGLISQVSSSLPSGSIVPISNPMPQTDDDPPAPTASITATDGDILPSVKEVQVSSQPSPLPTHCASIALHQENGWDTYTGAVLDNNHAMTRAGTCLADERAGIERERYALQERERALEQKESALLLFKHRARSNFPSVTDRERYFAVHGLSDATAVHEGVLGAPALPAAGADSSQVLRDQNLQLHSEVLSLRAARQSAKASCEGYTCQAASVIRTQAAEAASAMREAHAAE